MKLPRSFISILLLLGFSRGFPTSNVGRSKTFLTGRGNVCTVLSSTESSSADVDSPKVGAALGVFLDEFSRSECDDSNMPPSLSIIMRSISQLSSGSDIRGRFVDHPRLDNLTSLAHAISKSNLPALTPLAAHCLGFGFATMLKQSYPEREEVAVCVGRDPRPHGAALADAFGRGAEGVNGVRVVYTGIATTPAMFEFCRACLCDGGVMVTASHLPVDRNGFKFFTSQGGFDKAQIQTLIGLAKQHVQVWYDMAIIPPTSGPNAVHCSEWVNWMPHYETQLKHALIKQLHGDHEKHTLKHALKGLKIVLNSGNGSGGFFKQVLDDLGADVTASIHTNPDGSFPVGVPNPENAAMIDETINVCEAANADLGILLDTDADRCGMVVPRTIGENGSYTDYEPLNRNRLIAMMGVIFARDSPGCAIVTDSVTSNGLAIFLIEHLGLVHVRYLKGYANVINKARSLTESNLANAEVAIETSGHCALKENDYLDDGTYTALKVIGLLAHERAKDPTRSLLDLIIDLQEMDEVSELRMPASDGTLESTHRLFDHVALEVEAYCSNNDEWTIDEDNLEGIRISTGSDGGFFMLRKSLHDPVLSLQIEASSKKIAAEVVVQPLLKLLQSAPSIHLAMELSALEQY